MYEKTATGNKKHIEIQRDSKHAVEVKKKRKREKKHIYVILK